MSSAHMLTSGVTWGVGEAGASAVLPRVRWEEKLIFISLVMVGSNGRVYGYLFREETGNGKQANQGKE